MALLDEDRPKNPSPRIATPRRSAAEIASLAQRKWLAKWMPENSLSNEAPLNPYRVLPGTSSTPVDIRNNHQSRMMAGSPPRPALRRSGRRSSPSPISGWGKTDAARLTALASQWARKLAKARQASASMSWGDAAIRLHRHGFSRTAVREKAHPDHVDSCQFDQQFSMMAIELKVMADLDREISLEPTFRATYAAMARAFGRLWRAGVEGRRNIIPPRSGRGIQKTKERRAGCSWSSSPARRPRCRGRGT